MAPDSTHTAFGFDCALDWRPTAFVSGISSNRVCSACGLVPSNIAMLPCRHVLCQPCYERCVANAGRCCLDGEDIQCDDVMWSTFSVVNLLGRKILCWNAPRGCNVSGPASEVLDHFSKECQYHTIPCLHCKQSIAHKDIVNHIQSGSCTQVTVTESVTSENVTSGVAQVTNALSNLDTKVTMLQASLQEDLRRIANSVEVSSERMSHCLPVLESIHGLHNTLKESMQLSGQAVVEITEAQAALQNNTSTIMGSLQMVLDIVTELKASRNQSAGERSMTAQNWTCCEQARETLTLQDQTCRQVSSKTSGLQYCISGGDSSNMLAFQNGIRDEEPSEISALQNGTCGEKASESLVLEKQYEICGEEAKNTLASESLICGEESNKALQDCTCGKELSEALAPRIFGKEPSETLALVNQICTVESSQIVASPHQTCGGESNKTLASEDQTCSKGPSEALLLQIQLCGEEPSQTSASEQQNCGKKSSEAWSPQDQICELGLALASLSRICGGEQSETSAPQKQTCDMESSNTLSPQNHIHEVGTALVSQSQICGGEPNETTAPEKQTGNMESSNTVSPQDRIQEHGTALASQDRISGTESSETLASQSQTCSKESSKPLPSQDQICCKESSETSGPPNLISVQEPSKTVAGQNRICSEESSDPSAACVNLKHTVDELVIASAAERNEIKEKLKAVEKMVQDCMRSGSMNQSNLELFRREFRDKMRCLGPVSKWSFNNKLNVSKTLEWTVESWSDAKAQSRLLGRTTIYPESADYFYGYRILPSIVFETRNRFQSVTMGFQICRGTHDGLLMWPIKKTLCLMMLNPVDRSRCDSIVLNTADFDGDPYDRPGDEDNVGLVCGEKVNVRKLEGKGCVQDDKLSLQFYVMA